MNRRNFNGALVGAAASTSMLGCVSGGRNVVGRTVLYRSVGSTLTQFEVGVDAATLTPRASLTLPSTVQYVWPHPSRRFLYACTSDAPGNTGGTVHRLCAVRLGSDGAPVLHGEPKALATRPVHCSLDNRGEFALTCFNLPPNINVHRINDDGTLGALVEQTAKLDLGITPHQIRTTPGNRTVALVTRGNRATAARPEDPGALKLFNFLDGQLSPLANLPVGGKGGHGYGPRHLDYHPTQPWVYVLVEIQNQLHMHALQGDSFEPEPRYNKPTTVAQYASEFPQISSAIHVHPRGSVVYVSNRNNSTVKHQDQDVLGDGEDNIAVFRIDPSTGEPTLIQHVEAHGTYLRTFSIDPSGRLLVAAAGRDGWLREGAGVRRLASGLVVYRIADDGRLTFVRKYDLEAGSQPQHWVGMFALPG